MWIVELAKLEKIKNIISNIDFWNYILEWKISNYLIEETWENILSLDLEKNIELNKLFEELQKKIKLLLNYWKINENMFFNSDKIEEISFKWVLWYKNINEDNYSAHITLWINWAKKHLWKKVNFTANKIALFQLWNYCTCSKLLFKKET